MLTSLKQAKVTFTGKLACLSRQEAYQIVKDSGAEPAHGISRRTSVVVVGMRGWPLLPDGMISNKLKRAEELIKRGYKIEIISESFFLELAGLKERQASLRKTYAGEEVCKLLKISPETLQRWEQFSLVHSQNGLYDFQDLVSLRTIGELVNRGVRPGTIAESLSALSAVLPDTDRPLSQLKIVIDHPKAILVDMGECLMAPNGQLMINFDAQPKSEGAVVSLGPENLSADSWFEYGQTCEEDELYSEAEEAYRKAISIWPHFPEAYFNLGNVLRIVGKPLAAEELYRMAATQEPGMESAWYNLADIQEERGQIKEAIASLKCALQACPNYADAHFNLALCFEKIGQEREAGRHWVAYLKLDPSSQWAEIAKRRLSRH